MIDAVERPALADAVGRARADAGSIAPAVHPPNIAAAPFKTARRSDFLTIGWMRFMFPTILVMAMVLRYAVYSVRAAVCSPPDAIRLSGC